MRRKKGGKVDEQKSGVKGRGGEERKRVKEREKITKKESYTRRDKEIRRKNEIEIEESETRNERVCELRMRDRVILRKR